MQHGTHSSTKTEASLSPTPDVSGHRKYYSAPELIQVTPNLTDSIEGLDSWLSTVPLKAVAGMSGGMAAVRQGVS